MVYCNGLATYKSNGMIGVTVLIKSLFGGEDSQYLLKFSIFAVANKNSDKI